ncbi:hypothetical protein EV648_110311 [Kribbella sp. VKM Ac-2568]|nr:hypothetical protein [Kribbella sp. VKM Ac-2568]TCM42770.1 hypothetical protein EV648_110311 [Kribbella sp. VKM Ac-2568]
MANRGGGVIVYGITENQKAATGHHDIGEVDEAYERTLRSAAVTAISPPVFGLGVHRLGDPDQRALAVVVPASVDGPHLIYRDDRFGAPVRNDADTVWMRERQIEAMYRARFEEQRNTHEALDSLYRELAAGRPIAERAWMIGVARPRILAADRRRLTHGDATSILQAARGAAITYYKDPNHPVPLDDLDTHNPRPGLRRWVSRSTVDTDRGRSKEIWASVHGDGSVSLAAAIGGHPITRDEFAPGSRLRSDRMERFTASLMALLSTSAEHHGTRDYEVKIGVEWTGDEPLIIETVDGNGYPYDEGSIPLPRYAPVMASVRTDIGESDFLDQVRDLATDVVNQGGVQNLQAIKARE